MNRMREKTGKKRARKEGKDREEAFWKRLGESLILPSEKEEEIDKKARYP